MRIVLCNVLPDSNKGACALTWAALELVAQTFPGADVALLPTASTPPDPAPFRHTAPRYPHARILPALFDGEGRGALALVRRLAGTLARIFFRPRDAGVADVALASLRGADLVLSVGGVHFLTCDGSLRDDPRLVVRVLPLLAAQAAGVPVVLLGAQIGPFRTRFGRWLSRRIAARSALVLPREPTSEAELSGLALGPRSQLLPDSALALALHAGGGAATWLRRGIDPRVPTLALVASSALRGEERSDDHVRLLADIARRLLARGDVRQVVVVLQSDEDRAISERLVQALGLAPHCFVDDDLDPEQLSDFYRSCRLVVSSRLHAVLLTLLGGTPAISLAPEVTFKERAVLGQIGLDALWVPSGAGIADASSRCLAIAADHVAQRRAIVEAIAAAHAQWQRVPALLRPLPVAPHAARPRGMPSDVAAGSGEA